MQAIDKLKSDLDDWARRSGPSPDRRALDALRVAFSRSVGNIPEDTLSAVFTTFLSLYGSSGPRRGSGAMDWLGGVGSLLLRDYDGTAFTKDEWAEIREEVTVDAGEIDVETLSYILGQVLEHGGL
ncbi:MAG: hypothetical protein ABIJ86_16935 [Spirochaetota bacterium]